MILVSGWLVVRGGVILVSGWLVVRGGVMLGSGWLVVSNGVRMKWPCVSMVHTILTLASNTLSLSTMMSTTQPIPGKELMTCQAVLSWPGLLAGWCLNLPVVLSC